MGFFFRNKIEPWCGYDTVMYIPQKKTWWVYEDVRHIPRIPQKKTWWVYEDVRHIPRIPQKK
jgi:hypothetical protein